MSRILRALALAVLILTPALAAAPAQASFSAVVTPFCGKIVWGFGSTATEAATNALAAARADYFVFSYTTVEARCDTIYVPDPSPLDPFHTTAMTICSDEISICGFRKALIIP
jgi:hypothetical protein